MAHSGIGGNRADTPSIHRLSKPEDELARNFRERII
jgi:hypothetical protein